MRLPILAPLLLCGCTQYNDAAARHYKWVCENRQTWAALMIAALAKADEITDPAKRELARAVPLHELDLVASCAKTETATAGAN